MIIAITGIRDLHLDSHPAVASVIQAYVKAFPKAEFRFGGALGVDTVALRAAHAVHLPPEENFVRIGSQAPVRRARCTVIVPFTVADQPYEAATAIRQCAKTVQELKLPRGKQAFLTRNGELIRDADLVLAFTDAKLEGGTHYTMTLARKLDRLLVSVLVKNTRFDPLERPK